MSSAASTSAIGAWRRRGKKPDDWRDRLFALAVISGVMGLIIGLIFLFT